MNLSPRAVPYRVLRRISSVLLLAFFAAGSDAGRLVGGDVVVVGLAAAAVLAVSVYEVAYYRRFEYEFTAETLDIRSGVFGRRERELPYHRIQNVDVSQNAVQRLLGIAAVGFETAGGSHTEGSIRYVSTAEADRLTRAVQQRKRGTDEASEDRDREPEDELFALSPHELALVGALSFDTRVVGVLTILGPGSVTLLSGVLAEPMVVVATMGAVLIVGLLFAAWVLGIAVAVVNFYGFRLTSAGDEFRYERGLFHRYSGSIPRSKVQAITVEDNPLKRAFGYATLTVETAGYSPGSGGTRGSEVAIPIARRDRVYALAEQIEPFGDPAFERPPSRIQRRYAVRYVLALGALTAVAYAVDAFLAIDLPWYGIGALVPLALPAAHLTWRHRGYWIGPNHVVTRHGFWNRTVTVVPYYRVQTVIDSRTVFQRHWGVATVTVDTAGSFSLFDRDAAAVDVEIADAVELGETLNERLQESLESRRRARQASGPSG